MQSFVIEGEPVLWSAGADLRSAAREAAWKQRIRTLVTDSPSRPHALLLQFTVSQWTRRRHRFDLDNLVTPVLRAIYGDFVRGTVGIRTLLMGWRATIAQSPVPHLLVTFVDGIDAVGQSPSGVSFLLQEEWTGLPPHNSRDLNNGFPDWVQAHLPGHTPTESDRFGVCLTFGRRVSDITRPEEKPIKPVIDCLYPMFGGGPGTGQDWKKVFLQVSLDPALEATLRLTCWRFADAEREMPLT